MLHGWGYHAGVWKSVEEAANKNTEVRTSAIDMPGYGSLASSLFPETLDALAENLLQRAPQRAIWVGWSLGGLAAMRAAVLAPDRIKALLLICTTPKFVSSADWSWGMDVDQFQNFVDGLMQEYGENLTRFMLLQTGGSDQARKLINPIRETLASAPTPSLQSLLNGLELLRTTDLREELKQLQIPVHIISGQKDCVCFPEASEWIAANAGGSLTEYQCAHFPVLSHPSEVADQIAALTEVATA